jgi:hypothetical protein
MIKLIQFIACCVAFYGSLWLLLVLGSVAGF